jgi:hypothetical protein
MKIICGGAGGLEHEWWRNIDVKVRVGLRFSVTKKLH